MQQPSFLKNLSGMSLKFLPLAVVIWFIVAWFELPSTASWGFAGVVMMYAFLLSLPPKKKKEISFSRNIGFKLPIILVIASTIWFVAGKMGFPIWWQIEFVAFSFVGLFYFVILDTKPIKPEKSQLSATFRLITTYALASGLFITITAQLPQFNPQFEIEKLERPPIKLSGLAGPEVIAAGREVFSNNKCFNCHKVFWEGNSDRGPNLGTKQIGLYSEDYIKEQIIEPRKKQSPGYEDKKSKKAMPTYYDEDLSEDELDALVAYLRTMRNPTAMPVEGKFPNQWTWWDDPKILEEGKVVFEGMEPNTDGLNCAVCHGKDGIPMMTGALDFRNAENLDTDKMPDQLKSVKMEDWPDALWYKRVTRGIDGTAMAPWGMMFQHLYLWKAEAYARTFHDPIDKRAEKRPVPPVPTKEDIANWTTDELFLDPLL